MGDIVSLPLKGTDYGLKALNQIARVGLAARWLQSLAYNDPVRSMSRGHARDFYRRVARLEEALFHIEDVAEHLSSRLNDEDEAVYGTPQVVIFLKKRCSTLVIDNFVAGGLEQALARIDSLAARSGQRRLLRRRICRSSPKR
jgi:hypothetical protein